MLPVCLEHKCLASAGAVTQYGHVVAALDVLVGLDGPLGEFYDEPFASILSGAPASAFIADGSAVAVHLPERIV